MEKSKRIQGEKSSSYTSYRIVCVRLGMFTIFSSGTIKVKEKGPVDGKKCLKSRIFANFEYEINYVYRFGLIRDQDFGVGDKKFSSGLVSMSQARNTSFFVHRWSNGNAVL